MNPRLDLMPQGSGNQAAAVATERLWKVSDVAKFLQMSASWVYKQSEAGLLPCRRLGTSLRFHPADIQAFAAGLWRPQSVRR